jgi:HAE1 family hydrophobic/amphiphilic exporter-1
MLRFVIQRPIATSMLFLALLLIGVLSYKRLPVDLLPSITYPRLTVITTYEDIPAEDLERLVTQRIEEVVTALSGVRRVVSRTREGISIITVEYEWGTQMDFANLHLREAVDRVAFREDFPESAERPVILRWDPLSRPVSVLAIKSSSRIESITDFATEVVKPALEQVDGISQAEVVGGLEREILIEPDTEKLAMYGITIEDIRIALIRSNITFPGGKIRQGPLHLSLRIAGEFESLGDIAATDIKRSGETTVKVGDVARVLDTVKEPEGVTLLGSDPVVSFLLYKEPDANTIQVSDEVDRALGVLKEDHGDFAYEFIYRDADYVRSSFQGLFQSLVMGGLLAFLVLFFFLYDWRSPVVVGISIPVSIIITFAFLYFGRVKLNLMSLGGLSLAAGMLVDNSIVVLENINRHLAERVAPERPDGRAARDAPGDLEHRRAVAGAAVRGTAEVAGPVLAATLTTVAVFFPVVYVPGIAGAFFRDQALAVVISLLVSIAAALLLQPMLSARFLAKQRESSGIPFRYFRRSLERFHEVEHRVLVRALRRPVTFTVILVIGLIASGAIALSLDRSLMPARSSGDSRIDIELPAGTPLEETVEWAESFASWLSSQKGVQTVFSQVGRTEKTLEALGDYTAAHTIRVRVILEPGRGARERGERIQELATAQLGQSPGVNFAFREEGIGLQEMLATDEAPFSLGVIADDAASAVRAAEDITRRLSTDPALRDLRVDRVIGTPNVVVRLDAQEIHRSGLDPARIAAELRNRIRGVEATTFNEVDQRIDISVRIPREQRRDLSETLDAPVALAGGGSAPLRSYLDIREEQPVRELTRRNQRRMVTISADIQGESAENAWRRINSDSVLTTLPHGVSVVQSGERSEMTKSFRDLGWAMLLAVALVYMILAAQFESFVDPLLVASSIPIGLAGSILAIAVTGGSINVLSLIGMVVILGIAVNDDILKVDTIRRLREDGMDGYRAILEASRLRLRPILMTSTTTILGSLPMAIGIGSGEQLQRPLALTIIGGLIFSTALTLLYTPVLYQMVHRVRRPPG